MDDQQKYFVYMHINKINHKKYVGITCQKPTKRWGGGKGYKGNTHFYAAIQKYGWDNFEHVIYQSGLTQGQACGLEQQLILLFETRNPDKGYNFSGGGESGGYIDGRSSIPLDEKWKKYIQNETPEQREHRLIMQKKTDRKRALNETPEQREKRLAKLRDRRRIQKENETPEQREERQSKNREWYRKKVQSLTLEQLEERIVKRKERWKNKIQNETPEQREERLAKQRERARAEMQNETPEKRAKRLASERERAKKYRLNETPEQREERLIKQREYYKEYYKRTFGGKN